MAGMRLRISLSLTIFLLAAACSSTPTSTTSPTPATEPVGTTTTTDAPPTTTVVTTASGISLTITDCGDPTTEFEAFCDAYSVIQGHFVDDVDDGVLAAGAIAALEAAVFEPSPDAPSMEVTCSEPTEAFGGSVCEAIVVEIEADDASLNSAVEAAMAGMINVGLEDPYSVYLSPSALENFRIETSGSVEGIGALVRGEDSEDPDGDGCSVLSETCHMVIVQPLDGSPAEAAGIEAGDFVVAVDGESVDGKLLDEIVAIVRGPAGSDVTLGMERDGERFDLTVTRAAITVPNVEYEVLESGVAYLRLFSFASNADDAIRDAIADLLGGGVDEIIFDLRSNPGGSLNAAVNIASEFLEDGLVLVTEAPDDRIEYPVTAGGLATNDEVKLVVLVDRASASASEVVAGALQEAGRATIVGEVTFGKNTVQQQFNLENGGAIKLTIARWLTPGGADLGEGVKPDIPIEIDPDVEYESDPWLDAALDFLGR